MKKMTSRIKRMDRIANDWHFSFSGDNRIKLEARLKREGVDAELVAATIDELEEIGDLYFKLIYVLGEELLQQSPSLHEDSFKHPARLWAAAATMTRIATRHRHREAWEAFSSACYAIAETWKRATGNELRWSAELASPSAEAAEHPMAIVAAQMDGVGVSTE